MAKAKHSNSLPTLAQQAAALSTTTTAAATVQAAQATTKPPKVLGARTTGIAGAVGLPVAGNMAVNAVKMAKWQAYHGSKGRQSLVDFGTGILALHGQPWQAVAAALAAQYPSGSTVQAYAAGGQSLTTLMAYLQKAIISTTA